MEWLLDNKEWLLSGVAITIPLAIIGWFLNKKSNSQTQKAGDHSINIQVGGSINSGKNRDE